LTLIFSLSLHLRVTMELLNLALQHPVYAVAVILVGLYAYTLATRTSQPKLPEELPWVGIKDGQWFGLARASLRSISNGKQWLHEGYTKV
jgi:hypothetical protein